MKYKLYIYNTNIIFIGTFLQNSLLQLISIFIFISDELKLYQFLASYFLLHNNNNNNKNPKNRVHLKNLVQFKTDEKRRNYNIYVEDYIINMFSFTQTKHIFMKNTSFNFKK